VLFRSVGGTRVAILAPDGVEEVATDGGGDLPAFCAAIVKAFA